MPYLVSRSGQTYGPYTLEDLQRYVASGNVLLTDLAKSDEMQDWIPVAQILNPAAGAGPSTTPSGFTGAYDPATGAAIPPSYLPPGSPYGQPAAYAVSPYPDPPNLHWGLVLLITICTCGLFGIVWDFVQVLWIKRIEPQTRAFPYFIAYAVLSIIGGGISGRNSAAMLHGGGHNNDLSGAVALISLILLIVYRFSMRDSLERHFNGADPVGLRLGPIMTFFFGGLYFQYHFNRINAMKEALRYRSGI
jgi:hypothetical protein